MNAKYCANCGRPNYYSSLEPNSCSNCGSKFGESFKPKTVATRPLNKHLPREAYEFDENEDLNEDVDFSQIDLAEIRGAKGNTGIKFKDLAFDNSEKSEPIRSNVKLSKKQIEANLVSFLEGAKGKAKMIDIADNEKE